MKHTGKHLLVLLVTLLLCATAWADSFFPIPVTLKGKNIIFVKQKSTAAASGQALLDAVANAPVATGASPILIQLEPGSYDIGTTTLQMKPYVAIHGAGEHLTRILGTPPVRNAVIKTCNYARLGHLKIWNLNDTTYVYGLENEGVDIRITHVAIDVSFAWFPTAIVNKASRADGNAVMDHITIDVTGDYGAYGILNEESDDGGVNHRFDLTLAHFTIVADNAGMDNGPGARGILVKNGGSAKLSHGSIKATSTAGNDMGGSMGISAWPGFITGGAWYTNSVIIDDVSITAVLGEEDGNIALECRTTCYVKDSELYGAYRAAWVNSNTAPIPDGTLRIAHTRLQGAVVNIAAEATCAGVYDQAYTFYPSTCP